MMLKLHKVVTAVTKGEADSIWLTHKWEKMTRVWGFVRVLVSTSMAQGVSLIKKASGCGLSKECREAGVHSLFVNVELVLFKTLLYSINLFSFTFSPLSLLALPVLVEIPE